MQRRRWANGRARPGLPGLVLLALALLAPALLQTPAAAQSAGSVYTVTDIAINKQAQTGAAAREQGLAEARQAAFGHLFRRLMPSAYHSREPALPAETLTGLIAAVDVGQEQITATAYRADLAIRFAPARVRALLTERRIPFSDQPSPPLLIVPVYDWAGARQLWETPNPWHTAWSEQVGTDGLLTTLLAEGRAEEQLALSADQALAGDAAALQRIARSYNAGGAVVALGRFRVDPRSARPVLEVTLTGHGAAPPGPLTRRFEGNPGSRAGLAAEQLTRMAAAAMREALADSWKTQNQRFSGEAGKSLLVSVPLTHLGDYATALHRIREANAVETAVVARITRQQAQFRLAYRFSLEQVRQSFAQFGMRLAEEPGGWVLYVNG